LLLEVLRYENIRLSNVCFTLPFVISGANEQERIFDTRAHVMLHGQERAFNPNVDGTAKELRRMVEW